MEFNPDSLEPFPAVKVPTAIDWCHTQRQVDTYLYKWTITKFSLCCAETVDMMESSEFPTDPNAKSKWRLDLYPKGKGSGYLSLFLRLISPIEKGVTAVCSISLLDGTGEKCVTRHLGANCYNHDAIDFGYNKFIDLNVLNSKAKSLLPNDTLTLLCELSILSDKKTITGRSNITVPKCNLIEDLGNLLMNAKSADVTLAVGEHEIAAHKAILGARSPVFSAMFEHPMKESTLSRVVITDMDPAVVKEMLYFVYTGKSPNLDKMPEDLLAAADKYDLQMLKAMCEQELSGKVCSENAAETLILADRYNAHQLKTETINFINTNSSEVCKTLGWKTLIRSHSDLIAEAYQSILIQQHSPITNTVSEECH